MFWNEHVFVPRRTDRKKPQTLKEKSEEKDESETEDIMYDW